VKRNHGFSLLELLIVVAIILIIATIAIPSLLHSRQTANESAAVATLRVVNTAEVTYASANSGLYTTLTQLVNSSLLDSSLLQTKAGYNYSITLSGNFLDYTVTANAISSTQGRFDYYTTPDYVIRFSTVTTRAPNNLSGEPAR
jgi:prepilin-type N-terminal cleavage/methylation domain-containing protein